MLRWAGANSQTLELPNTLGSCEVTKPRTCVLESDREDQERMLLPPLGAVHDVSHTKACSTTQQVQGLLGTRHGRITSDLAVQSCLPLLAGTKSVCCEIITPGWLPRRYEPSLVELLKLCSHHPSKRSSMQCRALLLTRTYLGVLIAKQRLQKTLRSEGSWLSTSFV